MYGSIPVDANCLIAAVLQLSSSTMLSFLRKDKSRFTIRVKDENDIQSLDKNRIRAVVPFRQTIQHVKEVFSVSEFIGWVVVTTSNPMSVRTGSQGRHFSEKTEDLLVHHGLFLTKRISLYHLER